MFRYALKSFQRQTVRYVRLSCILICAMMIPLMLSILGSSSVYGERLEAATVTQNADYQIDGATQALAEQFQALDAFTVSFKDGSI